MGGTMALGLFGLLPALSVSRCTGPAGDAVRRKSGSRGRMDRRPVPGASRVLADHGRQLSVDIDPALVERAAALARRCPLLATTPSTRLPNKEQPPHSGLSSAVETEAWPNLRSGPFSDDLQQPIVTTRPSSLIRALTPPAQPQSAPAGGMVRIFCSISTIGSSWACRHSAAPVPTTVQPERSPGSSPTSLFPPVATGAAAARCSRDRRAVHRTLQRLRCRSGAG
jgi:hypothetical protein